MGVDTIFGTRNAGETSALQSSAPEALMRQLVIFFLGLALSSSFAVADDRPSFVIMVADDLGYGDLGSYGHPTIRTPNIDRLAEEGLRFTNGYAAYAVCSPTRAAVQTGRYPHRLGVTDWIRSLFQRGKMGTPEKNPTEYVGGKNRKLLCPPNPYWMESSEITIAEALAAKGYQTGYIGKWHLGWDWTKDGNEIDFAKPVKNGPDINGFDKYYGHCGSLDMPPYVWVDTGRVTAVPDREEGVSPKDDHYGWYRKGPIGSDFHIQEVLPHLFDKSMEYVNDRSEEARNGKPFFLYFPLLAFE